MRGLIAACALAGLAVLGTHSLEAQEPKPKIKRNPDVITAAEIAERGGLQNVLEAVKRLRPNWLRLRQTGDQAPPPVVVYVDGIRSGTAADLEQMPVSTVYEIRRLSGTDASTRYGLDHGSGALLITTMRLAPKPSPPPPPPPPEEVSGRA